MLNRYLEFKTFELFRDKLTHIISKYNVLSKTEERVDFYKHLFLAPSQYSNSRSFQITGAQYPYIALWATSPLEYTDSFYYARSCLPRDTLYLDSEGKEQTTRFFLYDYKKSFELTAGSYFKSFTDDVCQDILELDRLRYFDIDMSELIPGFTSRIEVKLDGMNLTDKVSSSSENRSSILVSKYIVSASMAIPQDFPYIEKINIYLNENKIYEIVRS